MIYATIYGAVAAATVLVVVLEWRSQDRHEDAIRAIRRESMQILIDAYFAPAQRGGEEENHGG